jgi:hypothetical protein
LGGEIDSRNPFDRETMTGEHETVLREIYTVIADAELGFERKVERLLEIGLAVLDTEYGALSHVQGGTTFSRSSTTQKAKPNPATWFRSPRRTASEPSRPRRRWC